MFTSAFWVATLRQAAVSAVYAALAVLGLGSSGADFFSLNWKGALAVAAGTALAAIAHALAPSPTQAVVAQQLAQAQPVPSAAQSVLNYTPPVDHGAHEAQ